MNLEKLKPWNWFRHEEGAAGNAGSIPVARGRAGNFSTSGGSLLSLHREMDRWFEDAMRSFGMPSPAGGEAVAGLYRPLIDVSADDERFEISLDVPGLDESDLTLELKDDVLTIKGRKEQRRESENRHYYRVERSYGSFQRTLNLPDDADADKIRASLDKGVLRLEIPRRAGADRDVRHISISA